MHTLFSSSLTQKSITTPKLLPLCLFPGSPLMAACPALHSTLLYTVVQLRPSTCKPHSSQYSPEQSAAFLSSSSSSLLLLLIIEFGPWSSIFPPSGGFFEYFFWAHVVPFPKRNLDPSLKVIQLPPYCCTDIYTQGKDKINAAQLHANQKHEWYGGISRCQDCGVAPESQDCARDFRCFISFNPHHKPTREVFLSPFYRWEVGAQRC